MSDRPEETLTGRLGLWALYMRDQQMKGLPTRLESDLSEAKSEIQSLRSALASCVTAMEKIKRAALPIANQIARYDDKPNVYHCHPEITVGELRALWCAVHDLPESADAALTAARSVG